MCLTKKEIVKFSKMFFANLSTNLVNNLPTTNLFGIDSVNNYYAPLNLENKTKFSLQPINISIILKFIEKIRSFKNSRNR